MILFASEVLNAATETFVRVYVVRLPWWALPALAVTFAAAVAIVWFVMRRRRPRR
jgi:hypothetical protein